MSRFSGRKKNCSGGNGQFREYRDYALSRVPRGFALADRRDRGKREQKPFSLQMENSRSRALYHIAINSKNARREKSVMYVCCMHASRMQPSICDPRFLGVSSRIPTYVSR